MKTGIPVHVLAHKEYTAESFILVDPAIEGPFEPNDRFPEVNIVRRNIAGHDYMHAVPASMRDMQTMFGGNFIWASDSRFGKVSEYPLPLHDRRVE